MKKKFQEFIKMADYHKISHFKCKNFCSITLIHTFMLRSCLIIAFTFHLKANLGQPHY